MKFVNHIDLLNLNVDINRLSDDILTLIEADEYKNFKRVRGQVPEPSSDWTDVRKRTEVGNKFRLMMND